MTALTPAHPDEQTPELWQRIAGQGWGDPNQRDAISMALRERAIRGLAGALQVGPSAAPLVAAAEADEDDDYWSGSKSLARRLGLDTDAAKVVSWLIALKVTTGERESRRFHAVSAAAADFARTQPHRLDDATDAFYRAHSELLTAFVGAQYAATQDLLAALDSVVLHRGAVIAGELPASPANPNLWPLASFAIDFATARSFAHRAVRTKGGTPVIYSAVVPVTRIAATPATGAASAIESEIVVLAGQPEDLATVTAVAPAHRPG